MTAVKIFVLFVLNSTVKILNSVHSKVWGLILWPLFPLTVLKQC